MPVPCPRGTGLESRHLHGRLRGASDTFPCVTAVRAAATGPPAAGPLPRLPRAPPERERAGRLPTLRTRGRRLRAPTRVLPGLRGREPEARWDSGGDGSCRSAGQGAEGGELHALSGLGGRSPASGSGGRRGAGVSRGRVWLCFGQTELDVMNMSRENAQEAMAPALLQPGPARVRDGWGVPGIQTPVLSLFLK